MTKDDISKRCRDLAAVEHMTDLDILLFALRTTADHPGNLSPSQLMNVVADIIEELESLRITRTPGN